MKQIFWKKDFTCWKCWAKIAAAAEFGNAADCDCNVATDSKVCGFCIVWWNIGRFEILCWFSSGNLVKRFSQGDAEFGNPGICGDGRFGVLCRI